MLIKLTQAENADSPIDVTEDGIFMLVKFSQQENAETPIDVTEDGIE
jgi:hypothetical protein